MIVTEEKRIRDLADNVVMRTYEVYQYDFNIANYQIVLAAGDGSYPEHLQNLVGVSEDQAVAQCSIDDLSELAELQQYARVSALIRSEIVERTKANRILQVVITQLSSLVGEGGYEAAVNAAVVRRDAALSA